MKPTIIVSGLPRSGTSMMMQMLAAAGLPTLTDGQRPADPDNPKGYFEFEAVKRTRENPDWLREAHGKAVKLVHLLVLDLPPDGDYRVIMMDRDPDEVIASQRKMLERLGRKGAALDDAALKKTFSVQLERVKGWLDQHARERWITVRYADVIKDPMSEAKRVARLLGLDQAACVRMAAAVDRSLYRNRGA